MEHRYSSDCKVVAKRIKEARKQAHITQAELAEKINISTNAVAKIESNLMSASLQTLISIANVLNIDINYLLLDELETNNRNTNIDIFLDSLISQMTQYDKEFIIHVINGLRIYKMNKGSNSPV